MTNSKIKEEIKSLEVIKNFGSIIEEPFDSFEETYNDDWDYIGFLKRQVCIYVPIGTAKKLFAGRGAVSGVFEGVSAYTGRNIYDVANFFAVPRGFVQCLAIVNRYTGVCVIEEHRYGIKVQVRFDLNTPVTVIHNGIFG